MPASGVEIEEVTEVTDELVEAWAQLMPQLSSSAQAPDEQSLKEIVSGDHLFVARLDGRIVGSLTLVVYRTPSGRRAHIDDVVVDEGARGRGIARLLSTAAIAAAEAAEVRSIELTSSPKREAANKLYVDLGFKTRETNLYRYSPN